MYHFYKSGIPKVPTGVKLRRLDTLSYLIFSVSNDKPSLTQNDSERTSVIRILHVLKGHGWV